MSRPDQRICSRLAALLHSAGVERAVLSPGSRNAPLSLALARRGDITRATVVDERSAAFIALGLATISKRPVALVCTSGSAVLNYGPALAEACYRQVPLIVVSADRPAECVDRGFPQTIRQDGVLDGVVKTSCDVSDTDDLDFVTYKLRDALVGSLLPPCGPLHINVHISDPKADAASLEPVDVEIPRVLLPTPLAPAPVVKGFAKVVAESQRVMIVAGDMLPNEKLDRALGRLAAKDNIAVLAECQSNLKGPFIHNFDTVLGEPDAHRFAPDLVITMGGTLVSGRLQKLLSSPACAHTRHWHIGVQGHLIDTYGHLSRQIMLPAANFIGQLATALRDATSESDYREQWLEASQKARMSCMFNILAWSDAQAFMSIGSRIPDHWNVQLSNGTAVRYAQMLGIKGRRVDCNRGVSGIDGSTSTAVGAAMAYDGYTLLITGDMSAQYDVAALAAPCIPGRYRMVVLDNCGGGIFRSIPQTAGLPEREELFAADVRLPLANLCRGYGLRYFPVSSVEDIDGCWAEFADDGGPAVMHALTPPDVSAEVFSKLSHLPLDR